MRLHDDCSSLLCVVVLDSFDGEVLGLETADGADGGLGGGKVGAVADFVGDGSTADGDFVSACFVPAGGVDDEADFVNSLKLSLESYDYQVMTAPSGVEALSLMEKEKFDIILSDYKMPHCDGLELLRRIHHLIPQPEERPLFYLITGCSEISREEMVEAGACKVLSKPISLKSLLESLEESYIKPAA